VLGEGGRLRPEVLEVLALVRDAGAILGTGHLDRDELRAVVAQARDLGLRRLLVTHPEHPLLDLTIAEQRELAASGAYFERCFCFCAGAFAGRPVPLEALAAAIRAVGVESTVISTDLGRLDLPHPIEGLGVFWAGLVRLGFTPAEVRRMGATAPAELLGI
jgi:hypothetical protein